MGAAELAGHDAALQALLLPFEQAQLSWPAQGRVLFMGARDGAVLHAHATPGLLCEQTFKPFADALVQQGLPLGQAQAEERFALVLVLPPRQRDERRAWFARALGHVAQGGVLVAACANHDGARSAQADLTQVAGPLQHLSKYKCRVFWATPDATAVNQDTRGQWLAADALRPTVAGLVSRPGLFAWDRIDAASALLAECLPEDLDGRVADLGAGAGYLSVQVVRRCPRVRQLDLFEADARAVPAAQANLDAVCAQRSAPPAFAVHWHDVAAGVPGRFDAIVSNPPFHQGHADMPELGRAFITAAAQALRPGGRFLMVANRHLAYEATLRAQFAAMRVVIERDGFKVIEARR